MCDDRLPVLCLGAGGGGCWSWRRLRGSGASFSFKGKTIKEIGRELGVSRKMVRKVLRSGATEFRYEREVQPRPKIGRWRAELDRLLAANEAKAARERLTLIRIFEELRGARL